ncbi:hypothetical protein RUND412_008778 [Rhizina undulata]
MFSSRTSPPPMRSAFTPHIAAPLHGGREGSSLFFRRLVKFPQMDFETAIWEMACLIIAPKKVFRSIYYHVAFPMSPQTKNTWSRDDPSFIVLLTFFLTLTSLAWGLAYTPAFGSIIRLTFSLVFLHFLLTSLVFAVAGYFLCGRFLRVSGTGTLGRTRLVLGEGDMEFMYCFEIGVRAFFPVWVFLYVVQFLMMPVINKDYWISTFLGNSLYLIAFSFYCVITFLGYNALPFLHHTEIMLLPIFILVVLWAMSLFGFDIAKHIVPLLLTGRT